MDMIFVTQSVDKLKEAERILNIKIKRYDIDLPEIQAVDIEDVVMYKVKIAFTAVNKPVMIEDTGLFINALNGLPGALIKWFVQRLGIDGLCRIMERFSDKSALAKTIIATYDGKVEPKIFIGEVKGKISPEPKGNKGFGWDAIFIPDGATKTFGQMTSKEKDVFSMRRLALEKIKNTLTQESQREHDKA